MAKNNSEHWFSKIATETANGSGRPWAFGIAGMFVIGWLLTGPIFHFSDTWQLVMNTLSSIVTFLMVFLIQNAQNRESTALQRTHPASTPGGRDGLPRSAQAAAAALDCWFAFQFQGSRSATLLAW